MAYLVAVLVITLSANPCQMHVFSFRVDIGLANSPRGKNGQNCPSFVQQLSSQAKRFTLSNMALCVALCETHGLALGQVLLIPLS